MEVYMVTMQYGYHSCHDPELDRVETYLFHKKYDAGKVVAEFIKREHKSKWKKHILARKLKELSEWLESASDRAISFDGHGDADLSEVTISKEEIE